MKQELLNKWADRINQYEGLIEFHREDKRKHADNPDVVTDCNAEIRRLNFMKKQAQEFINDLEMFQDESGGIIVFNNK